MTEEKIFTALASINTKLEYIQRDVEEIKGNMKNVTTRVEKLEKNELSHVTGCPQNVELGGVVKRVGDIEKDLEEYRVVKKYPKLLVIVVIAVAIGIIGSFLMTKQMVVKEIRQIEVTSSLIK